MKTQSFVLLLAARENWDIAEAVERRDVHPLLLVSGGIPVPLATACSRTVILDMVP